MNDWKTVRLGDVCEIAAGQGAPQGDSNYCNDGKPFVKAGNLIELIEGKHENQIQKVSEEVAKSHKLKKYSAGSILFAKSGMSCMKGYVYQLKNDSYVVSHLAIVKPKEDSSNYIEYCLRHIKPNTLVKDEAYPSISLQDISNLQIPLPPLAEQKHIAAVLNKCTALIAKHREMLAKYDTLIKSRFIEMFGDPVTNERNWEKVRLDSVADIKIGPFGSLLHQEDYITGGHALVNPSHIIDGRICTDEKLTISNEKYTELTPYHLQKHDVVMGRRGEMGRCAVVDSDGLLCGTGSLIIRTKGELKSDFIQKIISFPSYKKTIEDKAVGQTMPNLNVPIVSSFEIIKPPKEVQDNYYAFVQQIDKSKFAVQKSLEKAETLYKSLMQEYFG